MGVQSGFGSVGGGGCLLGNEGLNVSLSEPLPGILWLTDIGLVSSKVSSLSIKI